MEGENCEQYHLQVWSCGSMAVAICRAHGDSVFDLKKAGVCEWMCHRLGGVSGKVFSKFVRVVDAGDTRWYIIW